MRPSRKHDECMSQQGWFLNILLPWEDKADPVCAGIILYSYIYTSVFQNIFSG